MINNLISFSFVKDEKDYITRALKLIDKKNIMKQ